MPRFALPLLFSLVLACGATAAVAGYLIRSGASSRAVLAIITLIVPMLFVISLNVGQQLLRFLNRRL